MESLATMRAGLMRTLHHNEADFSYVNIRIMLRTGVNLKSFRPDQDTDPQAVQRVGDALKQLGYVMEGTPHGR